VNPTGIRYYGVGLGNETGATEKAEAIAAAARNKTARIIVCMGTDSIHI